jgi:hypothetical protein
MAGEGIPVAASRLDAARSSLAHLWESARNVWTDRVRDGFDKQHLTPITQQTAGTIHELQRLAEVVAKARAHVK